MTNLKKDKGYEEYEENTLLEQLKLVKGRDSFSVECASNVKGYDL